MAVTSETDLGSLTRTALARGAVQRREVAHAIASANAARRQAAAGLKQLPERGAEHERHVLEKERAASGRRACELEAELARLTQFAVLLTGYADQLARGRAKPRLHCEPVRRAFELFDDDASGRLDAAAVGPEVQTAFEVFDADESGSLEARGSAAPAASASAATAAAYAPEPSGPPHLLLVCAPGAEADQLRALLLAADAHRRRAVRLVGVVACGATGSAWKRARLVRAALAIVGLASVPVAAAEAPAAGPPRPASWEYSLRGWEQVGDAEILPAPLLFRQCLRSAPRRGLRLACVCDPSVLVDLTAAESELLEERLAAVGLVGGLLRPVGGSGWRPDPHAPTHSADLAASTAVYHFFLSRRVPLHALSLAALLPLPIRLAAECATLGGELWSYLHLALTRPLAELWGDICAGAAPPALDRAWFARSFCDERGAEPRGAASLPASADIAPFLCGSLLAPASALLLLLLPDASQPFARAAAAACELVGGATHFIYTAEAPLPYAPLRLALVEASQACAAMQRKHEAQRGVLVGAARSGSAGRAKRHGGRRVAGARRLGDGSMRDDLLRRQTEHALRDWAKQEERTRALLARGVARRACGGVLLAAQLEEERRRAAAAAAGGGLDRLDELRRHTLLLSAALAEEREATAALRLGLRQEQFRLQVAEHTPGFSSERAAARSGARHELELRRAELRRHSERAAELGSQLGDASARLRAAAAGAAAALRNAPGKTRLAPTADPSTPGQTPRSGVEGLSAAVPAAVREAFAAANRDGSGGVLVLELRPTLRALGLDASSAEAISLLAHFDADGSGSLDLVEFSELHRRLTAFEATGAAQAEAAPAASAEVQTAFEAFDVDGSGSLETRELRAALTKLGVDATTSDAISALQRFDGDGDGSLDLAEFAALVAELLRFQAEQASAAVRQEVRAAFELFDTDHSGELSTRELRPALRRMGVEADAAHTKRVLLKYDGDGSGSLDLAEFAGLVGELLKAQQPAAGAL